MVGIFHKGRLARFQHRAAHGQIIDGIKGRRFKHRVADKRDHPERFGIRFEQRDPSALRLQQFTRGPGQLIERLLRRIDSGADRRGDFSELFKGRQMPTGLIALQNAGAKDLEDQP